MLQNPKSITAIIVDDEVDAVHIVEKLLAAHSEIELVGKAFDGTEAVKLIIQWLPDLVFLDIQMPDLDGFEVIKEIKRHGIQTTVIFVTAYNEFAIEAIRSAAFDFLVKPVKPDELHNAITRFRTEQPQHDLHHKVDQLLHTLEKNKKLQFNTRTGFVLLNSSDIIYCASDRNYSIIYYGDQKKEVVTCNLANLTDLLPKETFRRISRFAIINTDYLAKVDRKRRICILTRNGVNYELDVSRESILGLEQR